MQRTSTNLKHPPSPHIPPPLPLRLPQTTLLDRRRRHRRRTPQIMRKQPPSNLAVGVLRDIQHELAERGGRVADAAAGVAVRGYGVIWEERARGEGEGEDVDGVFGFVGRGGGGGGGGVEGVDA